MEPRIQYARTKDAVSIAFWEMGKGTPLVYMPIPPFSHVQLEWEIPECRLWYERLAEKRRLIRYDGRGAGLSDRDVTDYSLDAQIGDLEAVVDSLRLETFDLLVSSHFGPIAIAYAARNPQRVSHLLLWCATARGLDWYGSPRVQARLDLLEKDFELYTETTAHTLFGWSAGEPARQIAVMIRESITKEALQAEVAATREFDITDLMGEVRSPCLVLHRRQYQALDLGVARGLASRIPGAQLALLDGESLAPYLGDTEAALRAIDDFLAEGQEPANAGPAAAPADVRGLVTILFTDMEGSTTVTQRLGDAAAQELLRTHNAIIRDALKAHGGMEIKHTGDGIMASFASASRALECAIAFQRAFDERNASLPAHPEALEGQAERTTSLPAHPEALEGRAERQPSAQDRASRGSARAFSGAGPSSVGEPIRVRIGLNAGEPVSEDEDLFGTAVQLAARICAQGEPGRILVSNVVRELVAGKGFLFSDRGEVALRGFEDPVRVYEVSWEER